MKIIFFKKFKAASFHFCINLLVAILVAAAVFFFWFPHPYRVISGGVQLFWLVVAVDVVLGPLLTFVVFNAKKPLRTKIIEFFVIGCIQLAALVYGMWSVYEGRPVHIVFEYDRFRVLHASDLPLGFAEKAPAGIDPLPLTGPTFLALRPLTTQENFNFTIAALSGLPLSAQTTLWQPYEKERSAVLKAARPVSDLLQRVPQQRQALEPLLLDTHLPEDRLVYLPLQDGRRDVVWTLVLDSQDASPQTYLPVNSLDWKSNSQAKPAQPAASK